MQSIHGFFTALNDLVWGIPMIVLIRRGCSAACAA